MSYCGVRTDSQWRCEKCVAASGHADSGFRLSVPAVSPGCPSRLEGELGRASGEAKSISPHTMTIMVIRDPEK